MSSDCKGLVVTFEKPLSEEYAKRVMDAIYMIQHVASVDPLEDDFEAMMSRRSVQASIRKRITDILWE